MAIERIQQGETERVKVYAVDSSAAGVTGATLTCTIRRDSDGYFWNSTTNNWQSGATTFSLTETDSTNLAGWYHYDFSPSGTDFRCSIMVTTATAGVVNDPWGGDLIVGYWVDNLDSAISTKASQTDMTTALKRLGATICENEFRRINAFLDRIWARINR